MYIGRPQKTGPYIKLDDISSQFNGSDVTFSLTSGGSPFYADNPYAVTVSLNGVVQEPVSAYTIVGDQITFASPPAAASDFFAVVYGTTVNRELRNATSLATGVDIIVGSISADNITSSGIVTAIRFEGDGSQLTGIDATALKDSNGTVRVQANTSGAVVTGIITASNGFNLGISSTGTSITNGGAVTTLNFVGAGNSISYDSGTRTVDISISSGSDIVIVDGGNFNSASSVAGAGSEINGGEFT